MGLSLRRRTSGFSFAPRDGVFGKVSSPSTFGNSIDIGIVLIGLENKGVTDFIFLHFSSLMGDLLLPLKRGKLYPIPLEVPNSFWVWEGQKRLECASFNESL